jgi:hypothetical protein
MTTQNKLEEIKARINNATPGPWVFHPADECDDWIIYNSEFTFVKQDDSGVPVSKEDGALIANAPSDLTYLLALVEKYRAALNNIYNTGTNGESYATIAGDSHRIARQALEEKAE